MVGGKAVAVSVAAAGACGKLILAGGTAWRTDPAGTAALRASYERTVAVAGRGPSIQPIPGHL